jgi:60 kDa SS-A/Ro ribonucleoprotein
MIKKDAVFFAKALIHGRNDGYMRTVPTFGLVLLSEARPDLFSVVFQKVIRTPNDLYDFMTMTASRRKGSQGGRAIKRTVGKWLSYHFGEKGLNAEYWTIKYGGEKQGAFSLADILKTTHPEGVKPSIAKYILGKGGRVLKSDTPKLYWFNKLKAASKWEDKAEAIMEGQLPHEVATSFAGSSKEVWKAIVPNLPVFAMLRNLNTLTRHGVIDSARKDIEAIFKDAERIHKAKIFPFRFLDAFNAVTNAPSWVRDAIRDGLDASVENVPDFKGDTVVFLDISGSMQSFMSQAALFGVSCTVKGKNNKLYLFDTQVTEAKVSRRVPVLDQANKIQPRGGTDTSAPFRTILNDREKYDNIILITDEQQNTGTPAYSVFKQYCAKVNKNAKLFVVDVSPYRNAVVPKDVENVWYIYGWSDNVLRYIAHTLEDSASQVDFVNKIELFYSKKDNPAPVKTKRTYTKKAAKRGVGRPRKSKD